MEVVVPLWLRNVTVADRLGANPPSTCWVEVTPTGAVRPADDPPAGGEPVLDGSGLEIELAPHAALAEALLEAIISGDRATASELYADDLVVWHNHDGLDRDKAESLDLIEALARDYAKLDASNVHWDYLADGYVQRTAFHVVDHAGACKTVDAMMRVWVRDGRITRVEEYSVGGPDYAGAL
jgi:ketosteroid isomerase-like protein